MGQWHWNSEHGQIDRTVPGATALWFEQRPLPHCWLRGGLQKGHRSPPPVLLHRRSHWPGAAPLLRRWRTGKTSSASPNCWRHVARVNSRCEAPLTGTIARDLHERQRGEHRIELHGLHGRAEAR